MKYIRKPPRQPSPQSSEGLGLHKRPKMTPLSLPSPPQGRSLSRGLAALDIAPLLSLFVPLRPLLPHHPPPSLRPLPPPPHILPNLSSLCLTFLFFFHSLLHTLSFCSIAPFHPVYIPPSDTCSRFIFHYTHFTVCVFIFMYYSPAITDTITKAVACGDDFFILEAHNSSVVL